MGRVFDGWNAELSTLGGTSAMRDIAALGNTVLNLTTAHPSGIAQLYAGRPTLISTLVRDKAEARAAGFKAAQVKALAEAHAERYGLPPIQLGLGIAFWTVEDVDGSEVPMRVPVMLRGIDIRNTNHGLELELEPSVSINPELVRALTGRGIPVDPAALARDALSGSAFNPTPVLRAVEAMGQAAYGDFTVKNKSIVGVYEHPGQTLMRDIDYGLELLQRHPVIAALAGDESAQIRLLGTALAPRLEGDRPPDHERGVGDLTPSQSYVVDVVAAGASVLVDTPPGPAGPATVAAVIADSIGSGRSVLYVGGQRRSAQAVARTLQAHGLGEGLLDLKPAPGWPNRSVAHLVKGMYVSSAPVDAAGILRIRSALTERSAQISAYIDALHQPMGQLDVSAYDALEAIARITEDYPSARTTVRLNLQTAARLDSPARDEVRSWLEQGARLGMFRVSAEATAWFGAAVMSESESDQALTLLDRLRVGSLAQVIDQMKQVTSEAELAESTTIAGWGDQLDMLVGVRQALDQFIPEVFERSPSDMVAATATAEWRAANKAEMSNRTRRRLIKQAKDLVRPGLRVDNLHQALEQVAEQRQIWLSWAPDVPWPRLPAGMAQVEAEYATVRSDLDALDAILTKSQGESLVTLPFDGLIARLDRLDQDRGWLDTLPKMNQLAVKLHQAGLGELLGDLTSRRVGPVDPEQVEAAAEIAAVGREADLAWWSTALATALEANPDLAEFGGDKLGSLVESYCELDVAHIATKPTPIRAAICAWRDQAAENYPGQAFKLAHAPAGATLRQVIADAPNVALKARPCIMAGPVMVPGAIPLTETGGPVFDLVIVDGADAMSTAVAVPTLGRGHQVVVFGDTGRAAAGSLTQAAAQVMPKVELPAEGQERDPRLARLLESVGYATLGPLLPMPSSVEALSWHYVDGVGRVARGGSGIDAPVEEIDLVGDLVHSYLERWPGESLAVVGAGPDQAERLLTALNRLVKAGDELIEAALAEPAHGGQAQLMVADAVAASGLTAKTVVLACGFARSPRGNVLYDFDQLDGDEGAAILAGALVGAERRLAVVSSLKSSDLDDDRLHGAGPALFKRVLDLAQHSNITMNGSARPTQALFSDLARRIERRGLGVTTGYGRCQTKVIPMVVSDPATDNPDVAVLSDDAAFVAEPSLRTKLRHWPCQLESLGWSTVQTWSAPVFMDPETEARTVVQAACSPAADA